LSKSENSSTCALNSSWSQWRELRIRKKWFISKKRRWFCGGCQIRSLKTTVWKHAYNPEFCFFCIQIAEYPQQINSYFHLLLSVYVCTRLCVWVQLSIPGSAEFSKLQNFMSKQVTEEFLSTWRPFPFPPKPDPCCRSALRTFPCQNPNDPRSKRILREEEEEGE
jgi:hypothetical protein